MSPRQTALKNGDIFYEGKPCKRAGHTPRYTLDRGCVACKKLDDAKVYKRNKETDRTKLKKRLTAGGLKRKYDITPDEWLWMWKEQGGKCARPGCNHTSHNRWWDQGYHGLFVDHCHETGMVRGLLCQNCNKLLGWVEKYKDDILWGMEYTKTWEILPEGVFTYRGYEFTIFRPVN